MEISIPVFLVRDMCIAQIETESFYSRFRATGVKVVWDVEVLLRQLKFLVQER